MTGGVSWICVDMLDRRSVLRIGHTVREGGANDWL